MDVLVPFDAREPKTRLAPVLDADERDAFARAMLTDVLEVVRDTGHSPEVLSTAPLDHDCPVSVDDQPLTAAVNETLADRNDPLAVVMADLALLTTGALDRLTTQDGDVVLAPGAGGGTNAMVVRHPDFRVDYHGASFRDHCEGVRDCGASLGTVDSFRLAVDIDEPVDLVEVLLHGEGQATAWAREAGFRVVTTDGRATARRDAESR